MADKWDLDSLDSVLREDAREFLDQDYSTEDELSIGFEAEFGLLEEGEEYEMVDGKTRQDILDDLDEQDFDSELGSWVIEADIGPLTNIGNLSEIENAIQEAQNELVEAANKYNVDVMRYGSLAFDSLQNIDLTEGERYRMLPEFHAEQKILDSGMFDPEDFKAIDSVSSKAPAGINGFQTNIQAKDRDDAIRKNKLIDNAQTYVDAIMGNAGIIDYQDTGFNDVRIPIWQINFNHPEAENKVGPWETYPETLEEYVAGHELSLPVEEYIPEGKESIDIINAANSERWKTSRIKREGDVLITESRLPSVQQSPSQDTQVAGFILGHMAYHQHHDIESLGAEKVKHNYESSTRDGLEGSMINSEGIIGNTRNVVLEELEKAKQGLDYIGIEDSGYLDGLAERVETGLTPGEEVLNDYHRLIENGESEAEAMKDVLPKAFYGSVQ